MTKKFFLIGVSFLILGMVKTNSLFILAQEDTNNKEEGISQVNYTGAQYRDPLELPMALRPAIRPVVEMALEGEEMIEEQIIEEQIIEREKEVVLPTFAIQGMVWGGTKPQALINDQLCEKGDIVRGAEITEITKEGVTFVYKDKKLLFSPTVELRKIAEKKEEYGREEREYGREEEEYRREEEEYRRQEEEYQIEPIGPAE